MIIGRTSIHSPEFQRPERDYCDRAPLQAPPPDKPICLAGRCGPSDVGYQITSGVIHTPADMALVAQNHSRRARAKNDLALTEDARQQQHFAQAVRSHYRRRVSKQTPKLGWLRRLRDRLHRRAFVHSGTSTGVNAEAMMVRVERMMR